MNILSFIWDLLENATKRFWNAVKRLCVAIFNLAKHAVNYFQGLSLNSKKYKPFIANAQSLGTLIKDAPTRNIGIFQGAYNMETDELEHCQIIEANELDARTKEILGNEALVVLS